MLNTIRKMLFGTGALIMAHVLLATSAAAQVNYGFTVSSGEYIELRDYIDLQYENRAGACQSQGGNRPEDSFIEIGFPFVYDDVEYYELYVNSNGFLSFGEPYSDPSNNSLEGAEAPIIAAFWDHLRVTGGDNGCGIPSIIRSGVIGDKGSHVLVVEWVDVSLTDGCSQWSYAPVQFQIRLYEGTNQIEFYYGTMDPVSPDCSGSNTASTSGSIGLATPDGFLSVTPVDGTDASSSMDVENDAIELQNTPIADGVTYLFCPAKVVGNVEEGGTEEMQSGDVLLQERALQRYSSSEYRPYTLNSPCAANFTYSISGPAAGDYTITPSNGELDPERGNTPVLTFRPTNVGARLASLDVRDDRGFVVRSYALAGEGITRARFVGDITQGGTADLEDGDILMSEIKVRNGSSASFTPIQINILGAKGEVTPNAPITYTLNDPTGQFSIDKTFESVVPGNSSVPVITFAPNGYVDYQTATLTVDVEGEVRIYTLRPFASGPGARFFTGGQEFANGSALFRNIIRCVGEETHNVEFQIRAIGDETFVLNGLDVFQVDSRITQGAPPYPLMRDAFGRLIRLQDYFVSTAPSSRVPLEFPIELEPGETKTLFLIFNPNRPGRRTARAFINSNGENFEGLDNDQETVVGMINIEFAGDGISGRLSNLEGLGLPKAIVFDPIDVRSTATATGYVRNNGTCDLRISADKFELVAGDIEEFSIVSAFPNSIDPATGDFVIPAGGLDSIMASFTPNRSGSRRASLRLMTNDSLVVLNGVNARGEIYIDLFGVGNVGLEARGVEMPPAVINGDPSQGKAIVENTSAELLSISSIQVISATNEFAEDPSNPWPSLPVVLNPGKTLDLGLLFTPDPANGPGVRTAVVEVTLTNGNVLTIDVSALAGLRTLAVTPTDLFQGAQVQVGEVMRAFTLVTNTGTFPVQITDYKLTGASASEYTVSSIAYTVIQPGQTLPVEVTFIPTTVAPAPAVLEFTTNSTNGSPVGTHLVTLGGEGTSTSQAQGEQSSSVNTPVTGDHSKNLVSGVHAARLQEISPNPVTTTAAIRYEIPAEGEVQLGLYDMQGRLVRSLASETRTAGEYEVQADLQGLPSGQYVVHMQFNGSVQTRVLNLIK